MEIKLSPEVVLAVVGISSALITATWHIALAAGRLFNRMERVETKVEDHDVAIREFRGESV